MHYRAVVAQDCNAVAQPFKADRKQTTTSTLPHFPVLQLPQLAHQETVCRLSVGCSCGGEGRRLKSTLTVFMQLEMKTVCSSDIDQGWKDNKQ